MAYQRIDGQLHFNGEPVDENHMQTYTAEAVEQNNKELAPDEVIADVSNLSALFNPTTKVVFKNSLGKIVFIIKRFDPGTAELTNDFAVLRSIVRLHAITELNEKKLEGMTPEDFEQMFDEENMIMDLRNQEHYDALVISYCCLDPILTVEQVKMNVPRWMQKELISFIMGGVTASENDVVSTFPEEGAEQAS